MFPKLIAAKSLPDFSLRLKYNDGTEGNVSLKKWSTTPVFSVWNKSVPFDSVFIVRENVIAWNEELEIDADSLYLELKGITFEELKSQELLHAATK